MMNRTSNRQKDVPLWMLFVIALIFAGSLYALFISMEWMSVVNNAVERVELLEDDLYTTQFYLEKVCDALPRLRYEYTAETGMESYIEKCIDVYNPAAAPLYRFDSL